MNMDYSDISADSVFLQGIRIESVVGPDAWHRPGKPQPVIIDVELFPLAGLKSAAEEDNVALTLDYGKLYKALVKTLATEKFPTIQGLFDFVRECLPPVQNSKITVSLPKAILLAEEGLDVVQQTMISPDGVEYMSHSIKFERILCTCIVGVNPHERLEKQRLYISIVLPWMAPRDAPTLADVVQEGSLMPIYQDAVRSVVERVEGSSYQTVEALATAIAQFMTTNYCFEVARVKIEKPSAIANVQAAGITITRDRSFFENKDFWKVKRP